MKEIAISFQISYKNKYIRPKLCKKLENSVLWYYIWLKQTWEEFFQLTVLIQSNGIMEASSVL